jgi:hypothetical protein
VQRVGGDQGVREVGGPDEVPADHQLAPVALALLLRGGGHREGHAGLGVRQGDEAGHVADELAVEGELAREPALVRPDPGAEDGRNVVRVELPEQAVERGVAGRFAVVAAALAVEARQAERDALRCVSFPQCLTMA